VAAREVVLPVGARAKVRDEGLVVLWTVLTIGIWTLVWYYRINREMRDFGRSHGDEKLANSNPVLSILAVTLGALVIVPAIVSYWRTTGRIRRMQGLCNVPLTEGWVIAILYVLGFFILLTLVAIPPYVQSGLNKVWNLYPPAEDGQAQLPLTAAEPQPAPTATQGQAPPQGPPPDPADRLS
jgi:Domain of unknown function (DUF4234)